MIFTMKIDSYICQICHSSSSFSKLTVSFPSASSSALLLSSAKAILGIHFPVLKQHQENVNWAIPPHTSPCYAIVWARIQLYAIVWHRIELLWMNEYNVETSMDKWIDVMWSSIHLIPNFHIQHSCARCECETGALPLPCSYKSSSDTKCAHLLSSPSFADHVRPLLYGLCM